MFNACIGIDLYQASVDFEVMFREQKQLCMHACLMHGLGVGVYQASVDFEVMFREQKQLCMHACLMHGLSIDLYQASVNFAVMFREQKLMHACMFNACFRCRRVPSFSGF